MAKEEKSLLVYIIFGERDVKSALYIVKTQIDFEFILEVMLSIYGA